MKCQHNLVTMRTSQCQTGYVLCSLTSAMTSRGTDRLKACHPILNLRYHGDAHIRDLPVEKVANDIGLT